MKANELMIGDWVLWHDEGWASDGSKWYEDIKSQVEGIEGGCLRLTRYDEYESNISEDCIEPIPLTEEILKANGFVYDDDWNCWLFEDFIISDYEEPFHAAVCGCKVIFQYVHELQHALRLCGLNELADNFKLKAMEE